MSKLKIGDKVKIKDSLVIGGDYVQSFIYDMAKFKGKTAKIVAGTPNSFNLDIDNKYWYWSEDMLEKVDFTKEDLKAGYVVRCRDNSLRFVMPMDDIGLILVKLDSEKNVVSWTDLKSYSKDLLHATNNELDVLEIYGFSKYACRVLGYALANRELLWKRENKKEMTVAEIEKELGYSIKIIKEEK